MWVFQVKRRIHLQANGHESLSEKRKSGVHLNTKVILKAEIIIKMSAGCVQITEWELHWVFSQHGQWHAEMVSDNRSHEGIQHEPAIHQKCE